MLQPNRTFRTDEFYHYGFNGKENDNEVKGAGNQQDYGMRIYDPRIGKFLSVDPITEEYPELTPYQFASNSPIKYIDIDGLEGGWVDETGKIIPAGPQYGISGVTTNKLGWTLFYPSTPPSKKPILAIPDVSSCSTCITPSQLRPISTQVHKKLEPEIRQGSQTVNNNPADKKIDPYVRKIANERKAEASERPGDAFPMVGSLIQSGRRYLNGDDEGAGNSFGAWKREMALSAIPITRIGRAAGGIWTSTRRLSSVENAFAHFMRHGHEFTNTYNAKQYVEAATNFLRNSPTGTLVKIRRSTGEILKYHPATNTFGVMTSAGVPKTYFKPTDGMNYWLTQ